MERQHLSCELHVLSDNWFIWSTTNKLKQGCGSDVPGHWYSLSTELNPDWLHYFADQSELRAYWEGIWRKHALSSHTVFNTAVTLSEWDDAKKLWRCTIVNAKTGEKSVQEAAICVSAIGGFMSPNFPKDVP